MIDQILSKQGDTMFKKDNLVLSMMHMVIIFYSNIPINYTIYQIQYRYYIIYTRLVILNMRMFYTLNRKLGSTYFIKT